VTATGRFFLPGPVEVHPDVARAMLHPAIGHRSAAAEAMLARVQRGLGDILQSRRPVMTVTGSATAMMEAAIRAGVEERILCVISGHFSERFARIAERCDKEVIRLHVPHGEALEPDLLAMALDGPPVDAVSLVHVETSTGVVQPVGELLRLLRTLGDVVTIVDAVSSVGGIEVDPDRWGADYFLGTTQKALGAPTGVAFAVASERFLRRADAVEARGLYLDPVSLHADAVAGRFPHTPSLPVVHALDAQLARIAAEGIQDRYARHRAMREMVEAWVDGHGRCRFMAQPGRRADTVSALRLRDGKSADALVRTLDGLGWQIATGKGEERDTVIRIGHMGDRTVDELHPLLTALEPLL
jgi:aspartate aminotransferase-like enzyme